MGRKRSNPNQRNLFEVMTEGGGDGKKRRPRAKSKPTAPRRSEERPVKDSYRPRTRKLAPGQSRTRTGAVDPKTGESKVFKITRVK
jgi:hypothetical protein